MPPSKAYDLFRVRDSVKALDRLLQRRDINVNLKNDHGDTALLKSLKSKTRSDKFIIRLLIANANPNIFNKRGESPLSLALRRSTFTVARELINKGANVNARKPNGETVLHEVARHPNRYNPQAVYFLLYYGADINDFHRYKDSLLELSLRKGNVALFKLIWERIDHRKILNNEKSFLISYFSCCEVVPSADWMDCLNLVLNSSVAFELVQQCDGVFLAIFLMKCCDYNVKVLDRLRIIYLALSLSIKVTRYDVMVAFDLYGFNEEFEILLYFINYEDVKLGWKYDKARCRLLSFCLGIADDLKDVYSSWSFQEVLESERKHKCLGYFHRSCYNKFLSQPVLPLLENCKLIDKLQNTPTFPSLLELSRTATRKFIRKTYNVRKPYEFHDAVKRLNIPKYIEDVIRFKVPIYL